MRLSKMCSMVLLGSVLLSSVKQQCAAGNSTLYKEANALTGYSEEEEWIGEKGHHLKNSIGFEWFKKYSNDYGDFLTTDLQMRLAYDTSRSSEDAWALEVHNAWTEYKLGLGKSVRMGHFSPAFGLEPSTDTHGTLFQTLAGQDIGFKKDWGAGFKSGIGPFDYELAAQIGSGMGIEHKDNSHLLSGRIGNPIGGNLQFGISGLFGEVLNAMEMATIPQPDYADKAVSKSRIGADTKYLYGPFLFMGEISAGRNDESDVLGALLEVDYIIPTLQELTLNSQCRFWSDDPGSSANDSSEIGLGFSWRVNQSMTVRSGVFYELENAAATEDTRTYLQLYYYAK